MSKNTSSVGIEFKGLKELNRAIQRLPEELQKRAYRSVITTGARVIASHARKNISTERTGLLKKSIGVKAIVSKGANSGALAIIGPKRRVQGEYKGKRVIPANYSHLVEYGTSHSAAKPFIRPAIDSSGSKVMTKMAAGLNRFMTRAVASARRGR